MAGHRPFGVDVDQADDGAALGGQVQERRPGRNNALRLDPIKSSQSAWLIWPSGVGKNWRHCSPARPATPTRSSGSHQTGQGSGVNRSAGRQQGGIGALLVEFGSQRVGVLAQAQSAPRHASPGWEVRAMAAPMRQAAPVMGDGGDHGRHLQKTGWSAGAPSAEQARAASQPWQFADNQRPTVYLTPS